MMNFTRQQTKNKQNNNNKKKPTIKINKTKILMNNAVRSFSAVSPALHPSFVLFSFTFNYTLFFSLTYVSSYKPSFFRCSGSTDAIFVERQCESHVAFPRITFTYVFIAHTYPSYPFSSVFFINVFLLSVYIYHSSTFFFFR